MKSYKIDIEQSVRDAMNSGFILQTRVDEMYSEVLDRRDTRALAILADAVSAGLIRVVAL